MQGSYQLQSIPLAASGQLPARPHTYPVTAFSCNPLGEVTHLSLRAQGLPAGNRSALSCQAWSERDKQLSFAPAKVHVKHRAEVQCPSQALGLAWHLAPYGCAACHKEPGAKLGRFTSSSGAALACLQTSAARRRCQQLRLFVPTCFHQRALLLCSASQKAAMTLCCVQVVHQARGRLAPGAACQLDVHRQRSTPPSRVRLHLHVC